MGNLENGLAKTIVAIAEITPEQARHDAVYAWAVTDGGLRDEHKLEHFRLVWNERRFENCYLVLMGYLKYTPDADFVKAKQWKAWIESIRDGSFAPA